MRSNYDMSDFNPRLQNNLPNFPPVIGASNNDSKIVYDLIKPKINSFEEFLNLPEVKSTVNFLDDIQTNIIPLTSKIVDNYEEIKDFKPTQNPEHTSTDLVSTPALKTSQ